MSYIKPYSPATKVVASLGSGFKADYYTDGVSDQTEINAAISAVNALGGGRVKLIGYSVSSPAIITSSILPLSDVILEGEGMTVTVIKKEPTTTVDNSIEINNVSNVTVRDLKVIGNVATAGLVNGRGVHCNTATSVLIERVYAIDNREGFQNQSCSDVTYQNCIGDANYEWNYYSYAATRTKIIKCQSLNAKAGTLEGFGMAVYQNSSYCELVGNYIYNSAHNGIHINSGSATIDNVGTLIRDNVVANAGLRGINVTDDTNSFHVKKISIVNNRVYNSVDKGIYLIDAYDASITGNKSFSNTGDGIAYENCVNLASIGNISTSNNVGLRIVGDGTSVVSDNDWVYSNTTNFASSNATSGLITIGPSDITLNGQAARVISSNRETTSSTAGNNLTIQAGGAISGGTDLNGGQLILSGGIAVGNNSSSVKIMAAGSGQGTGITDRTPQAIAIFTSAGTNTQRARMSLGTNSSGSVDGINFGGQAAYQIFQARNASSGTAGNSLTITSGGSSTSATSPNLNAGSLILSTGISTGTGIAQIILKTADVGSSGTTDNAINTRVTIDNTGMSITGALVLSTALAVAQGGTGATTLTGILKGNGTSAITGSATTSDLTEGSNLYYTDARVRLNRLDQMAIPTASVSFNSQKITNLLDPTSNQDAATKTYVDSVATGLNVKASCKLTTTANISLSGTQTIDGVSAIAGDRILVKNQTTASQNGIYVVAAGAWSRSTDADTSAEVTSGMFTFITAGSTQGNTGWILTTANPITLDTTSLVFTQFSAATSIIAGNGLTLTSNTLDVVGTSNRIIANADSIDIDSAYVGQTSITTLGTIAIGTWNATTIVVNKGGTGQTTYTDGQLLIGNSSGSTLTKATLTAGNSISITNGNGSITLDTIQDLRTSASPTFSALSVTNSLSAGTATFSGDTLISVGGGVDSSSLFVVRDAGNTDKFVVNTASNKITCSIGHIEQDIFGISAGDMPYQMINTINDSTAHAGIYLRIQTGVSTNVGWSIGLDNSDDTFKIAKATNFSSNVYFNINASGNIVTGTWNATTIGILYGGTGATTAVTAFNNLSPLTTQGDILYRDASNNVRLPKGTGLQMLRMNSGATAPEWYTGSNRNLVELTSDVASTASTSFQNITGMSFSVTSGTKYRFYALIVYTTSAATIGLRLSLTSPATTLLAYNTRSILATTGSATNEWTNGQNTTDAGTTSTSSPTTGGNIAIIEGFIQPSASGTVQLRFAPETATASGVVIKSGSTVEWW